MSDLITRAPFDRHTIANGSHVSMHFSILLENGQEVDTTRGGRPASFVVGEGNLPEGIEKVLIGLKPGDYDQFDIAPDDCFGPRREENLQWMHPSKFAGMELEPGLMVSFAQAEGELPGVVLEVEDDRVCVDFNHPLAGKRLVFDVSVISVAPPADRLSE